MTKISTFIILLVLTGYASKAQYYYKDLVNASEAKKLVADYKANKIKTITLKNYEYNGEPNEDFSVVKKFNKQYNSSDLLTRSSMMAPSLMTTTYDPKGNILSTYDSSDISVVKTTYTYDAWERISLLSSSIVSRDDDFISVVKEDHIYTYDSAGMPEQMTKVLNGNDTTRILFAKDEAGNIAVEKNTKTAAKYYYYYDNAGRMTDIVLASDLRPGLHPEYIFTYNNKGDLTQMITTGAADGYRTWKYNYDNGLRIAEKLYGKDRKLMGSLEYIYK